MNLSLKEVSSRLWELEERPQFEIPPFPWEELQTIFAKRFPGKKVTLKPQQKGWIEGEPSISSFKEREIFPIFVSPVEDPLFWSMSKEDLHNALAILSDKDESSFYFLEKPIYDAFKHFFACEILKLVSELKFSEYLSFHISENKNLFSRYLEKEPFFIIDVVMTIDGHSILGSLFIPVSFRTSWKKHFLQSYGPIFSPELQKKLDLDLGIQIGHVDISWKEFKKAEIGDWIMLDQCTYKPDSKEGFGILTIGGEPIFRARLKKEELKVLEYPHLHRSNGMEEEEEDEFEEPEDLLEEEDFSEEEVSEEVEEESEENARDYELSAPSKEGNNSLLSKIPVHVVVEVSKLRMSLEDLGKLQAGALLELPVAYEEGVNLFVNEKKIGKGELVKIGEKMGVRITEL